MIQVKEYDSELDLVIDPKDFPELGLENTEPFHIAVIVDDGELMKIIPDTKKVMEYINNLIKKDKERDQQSD